MTGRLERRPAKHATRPRFLFAEGEQKPGSSRGMMISRSGGVFKLAVNRREVGSAVKCIIFA